MVSYQKLAALLLRVVTICWMMFIIIAWTTYGIELAMGVNVQHYPAHAIWGNVGYVVAGSILLFVSKPLGRLLGRDLDKQG